MEDFKVDFNNVEEEESIKEPVISESFKAKENKTSSKEVSGEINVSESLKDDENKKVKITFKQDNFVGDYVQQSTTEAPKDFEPATMLGEEKKQTLDTVKEEIRKAEEDTKDTFTIDDYEMISEFIIDSIDWGGSSLLMFLAKDNTDAPYVLSVIKKSRLKKQLTRILIKMEVKFNFTALFFISIILAYVSPVKKALESRKIVTKAEVDLKRKKDKEIKIEKVNSEEILKFEEKEVDVIKDQIKEEDSPEIIKILTQEKDTKIDDSGKVVRRRRRGGAKS